MSTRSQIRFIQRGETRDGDEWTRVAQVYRHSDGYPDGVLPALAELKQLQDATGTQRDPSYVAANFIFLNKLRGMGFYRDEIDTEAITDGDLSTLAELSQPVFLLGYGVEEVGDIHGDEEYIYVVELDGGTGGGTWNVKVSEHSGFPRWDDEREDAFDEAEWQFEGTLDEAIDELTATA